MKHIKSPEEHHTQEKSLFLAGGISGCEDWQTELINSLKDQDITLLNPRRKEYSDAPEIEKEQITWEFNHLKKSTAISFWFPSETLCPITLFELGAHLKENKPIFLGVHPEYKRKSDIKIQTALARSDIKIVYSLEELEKQIRDWAKGS